jgi:hypothetical protein
MASLFEQTINTALIIALLLSLSVSTPRIKTLEDRLHIIAVDSSFDFYSWTLDAIHIKLDQSAIGTPGYFTAFDQHQIVVQYIQLVRVIEYTQNNINLVYADPSIKDPEKASADLRQQMAQYNAQYTALAPLAEAILEQQVTQVLNENGLTTGGQPIPWVSYHITPLPLDLLISSRNKIEQKTSYQLKADLTIEQQTSLENSADKQLDVSSLVVPIGGLATYPTMIMRTTALDWLSSTIAHEWTHLYLSQRPLGIHYESASELRTMNETTADIAGNEIGRIVLEKYYPELLAESPTLQLVSHTTSKTTPETPPFDYRAEMHTTRVKADELLAAGKVAEAEAYMEERRKLFWDNGYPIRKLNQAFFAFYGAYADQPNGPAGEDPVGPAVRALRQQSPSLKAFLERIAQFSTFEQLKQAVDRNIH